MKSVLASVLIAAALVTTAACNCDNPAAPSSGAGLGSGQTTASLAIAGKNNLVVGEKTSLTATLTLEGGAKLDVTSQALWSNNGSACTIDSVGNVTGAAAGSCAVGAVYNTIGGQFPITVTAPVTPGPATLTGIRLDGANTVQVGNTVRWTATGTFSDGTSSNITGDAVWSSQSNSTATVTGGTIAGVAVGNTVIQAVYGGLTAAGPIAVTAASGPTLTVNSLAITGATSVTVGQTTQLQAVATMSDGSTQTVTSSAGWTSAASGTASVSGGTVTGVSAGSTTITATYSGKTAQQPMTVNSSSTPPPSTPTVSSLAITGASTLTAGQTTQLQAVATMSDGSTQTVTSSSTWSSSANNTATVNGGLVTGVAAGSVTITASYSGKTAQHAMTITAAAPTRQLTGIQVTADVDLTNLAINDLVRLHVFGVYSDGSKEDVTSAAVLTTDDPLLRVDAPGTVNVLLTAVSALLNPNHVINVKYGGFTADVQVKIKAPVLQSLSLSGPLSLSANSQLPAVQALFSQGLTGTIAANTPGLVYTVEPRGVLGTVLNTLGVTLDNVVRVVNGTVTVVNNSLLTQVLNLVGGVLPVNVKATFNGVTSPVVTGTIGG